IFEEIPDWTVLLFPNNMLRKDKSVAAMLASLDDGIFKDGVEIIGWMYQYYISAKREEVIDTLRGKQIDKKDIPAATQLFTTDWVVKYIVDNSLGRYLIERHPGSRLKENLSFFVQTDEEKNTLLSGAEDPAELKVFDPCVGSGHFLTYAFDVLMEIYRECGWSDRDAARSILKNNLFGIDIDGRAAQLACFCLAMKARKYDRRILNGNTVVNVMSFSESDGLSDEMIRSVSGFVSGADIGYHEAEELLIRLRKTFENAEEYGSLIDVSGLDAKKISIITSKLQGAVNGRSKNGKPFEKALELLVPLARQTEMLGRKYHAVVTNPPYLNRYSTEMKSFLTERYREYKGDLFSVFMYRNFGFCTDGGYSGFMTPNSWMFLRSYEALRKFIINNKSIVTLVQMAKGAFFKEATVDVCAFVLCNGDRYKKGVYFRLEGFRGDMDLQREKTLEGIKDPDCGYRYVSGLSDLAGIPGEPVAYWLSKRFLDVFRNARPLSRFADPKQGIATADNGRFLRLWNEVDVRKIKFDCESLSDAKISHKKWFPYNKGGDFRKWYGNNDYIVNWENDGYEIKHIFDEKGRLRSRPQNLEYMFRPSVSWSLVTSGAAAFRYKERGQLFDIGGMSFFSKDNLYYLLGLVNTGIVYEILLLLAPTLNCQCGDTADIPVITDEKKRGRVESLVKENVVLSKDDWDSFERSWEFKKHPFI
ncbi:MAG: BREX-1 system adenine-specific DNA-methyltransferase PglX, partial [Clostridia bacterium]|nr:BREX-1 system adenine-specific DNA-methyltransferase PglX [Clostridia bacterium]